MLGRMSTRWSGALAAMLFAAGSTGLASAATVSLGSPYARADLPGAQAALDDFLTRHMVSNLRVETFEGHQAWDGASGTSNPQNTAVGNFASLGGHGTGRSAINGGTGLEVRGDNDMKWGRYDTDRPALGSNWLDSNDTYGMRWEIGGLGSFNALAFFLSDLADVGATFSMKVGDLLFSGDDFPGAGRRLANGNIHFVSILLPEAVDHLVVEFRHDRLNDGFGLDGAAIAMIAPIPVPPAGALALAGLAAFAGLRARSACRRACTARRTA
jgi:hypothetical protein